VRYYRLHPYPAQSFLGEAEKELALCTGETALVSVHCWNIGFPDGPQVIPLYSDCMGWTEYVPRARSIIDECIRPAIDAARAVNMPIVHVAAGHYAHLYASPDGTPSVESDAIVERQGYGDHSLVPEEFREEGSVEGGAWWSEYYEEVFGKRYNEVWAAITADDAQPKLDIAAAVRPETGDYVVTHGTHLNRILRGLGIWNLVYVGFATDLCLMDVPAAMKEMALRFNYRCILLRDCTTTVEQPDTVEDRLRTKLAVRQAEYTLGYTTTSAAFVAACGRAQDAG
jgi:nicotinamidase-related amidase